MYLVEPAEVIAKLSLRDGDDQFQSVSYTLGQVTHYLASALQSNFNRITYSEVIHLNAGQVLFRDPLRVKLETGFMVDASLNLKTAQTVADLSTATAYDTDYYTVDQEKGYIYLREGWVDGYFLQADYQAGFTVDADSSVYETVPKWLKDAATRYVEHIFFTVRGDRDAKLSPLSRGMNQGLTPEIKLLLKPYLRDLTHTVSGVG